MGWKDAPLIEEEKKFSWQSAPIVGQDEQVGRTMGEKIVGAGEAGLSMVSGAIAEPIAGIAGIAQSINPFAEPGAGAEAVEATKQTLTYTPKTEAGGEALKAVGDVVSPIVEPISSAVNAASDYAYEVTGSPAIAAAVKTAPTAIAEAVGLGVIRKLRPGTKLIDDLGNPTERLRKELDKQGLVYENLTPEAKELIPNVAPPKIIPSSKAEVSDIGEKALIEQIKSGARDDALAALKVVNGKVKVDKFGQEAIRQGFDPGFVQAVKTANPQTKRAMEEMLTRMERITKNRRLALDIRPSDIAGDAAMARFKYIRNKADDARTELNVIANTKLRGKEINSQPVVDKLAESLDKLNVRLEGEGIPKPIYAGSQISKDRTSQKVINDLVALMSEGGKPDALRFHNLKRQLDAMIDFRKKSAGGLTDAGKNVLKDIRATLNEQLRSVDKSYANVNDVLSQSLTAIDDFKSAVGPSVAKIDPFSQGAGKAVGTKLRTLMSNQQKRVELDEALNNLDSVANNLGGKFNIDYKDLALFANRIEDKFGAVAETSLKGEIESATRTATTAGPKTAAVDVAAGKIAEKVGKLRGINDYNAFKSMRDLLKEQYK